MNAMYSHYYIVFITIVSQLNICLHLLFLYKV